MHSINELKLHNINAINEVVESNQTDRREDQLPRGYNSLGAVISAINRKKITDPKQQRREMQKIRQNFR